MFKVFKGLVILLTLFKTVYVTAQTDSLSIRPLKKNVVYGDAAFWLIYVSGNVYAERILFDKIKETHVTNVGEEKIYYGRNVLFFRGGVGVNGFIYEGGGPYVLGEFGYLSGLENHFEASLGVTYFLGGVLEHTLTPSGSIGYRYQSPKKHFVWRLGVGFPQSVYYGIGISF